MEILALLRRHPIFDLSLHNRRLQCIRSESFKYIIASDGTEELYNLKKDRCESQNVVNEMPRKARELKSKLAKELGMHPQAGKTAISLTMQKRLQKLGYL